VLVLVPIRARGSRAGGMCPPPWEIVGRERERDILVPSTWNQTSPAGRRTGDGLHIHSIMPGGDPGIYLDFTEKLLDDIPSQGVGRRSVAVFHWVSPPMLSGSRRFLGRESSGGLCWGRPGTSLVKSSLLQEGGRVGVRRPTWHRELPVRRRGGFHPSSPTVINRPTTQTAPSSFPAGYVSNSVRQSSENTLPTLFGQSQRPAAHLQPASPPPLSPPQSCVFLPQIIPAERSPIFQHGANLLTTPPSPSHHTETHRSLNLGQSLLIRCRSAAGATDCQHGNGRINWPTCRTAPHRTAPRLACVASPTHRPSASLLQQLAII
jgi:hypothetical protein